MKRPFLFCAVCLVILIAISYRFGSGCKWSEPADGTQITVIGKISQKNQSYFVIQTQSTTCRWYQNPMIQFQCEYDNAEHMVLGSYVVLTGDYYRFKSATNPGEFDRAKYYESLDYAGRLKAITVEQEKIPKLAIREQIYKLRQKWERRLYRVFPEKEASIMSALLLGEKENLDADVKDLYTRAGIIHILSISGLHISLIGMGIYKCLRKLGVPVWVATIIGSVLLLFYGSLTGFGISAIRAIGMYLMRMLAEVWGRTYDMLTAWGLLALLMVMAHPAWLTHMGFLLSFTSILGIAALFPILDKDLEAYENRFFVLFKKWFLAGFSIQLTTLPIQLWFSYEIPMYAPFLNVLVLPFMGVVVVAGMIAMLIPGMGIVGTIDALILMGYEKLSSFSLTLPHATWNPGKPKLWQVVVYYLIWICLVWGGKYLKKYTGHGLKCLAMFLAVFLFVIPTPHQNQVAFLDVGQGDCIVVQLAGGAVYLFDCGSSSKNKVGENILIPYLKYCGVSRVDGVFVSHEDADHMNGIVELFNLCEVEHIQIKQLILPDVDRSIETIALAESNELIRQTNENALAAAMASHVNDTRTTTIGAGVSWEVDGTKFTCLNPPMWDVDAGRVAFSDNAGSECFLLQFPNGQKLLLTGDIEAEGEEALIEQLKRYEITKVDVLKCAHHGSKGTTSEEFLSQIHPNSTIISCGRNNRYGHPHAETLERLERVGSQVYRTDQDGAIILVFE